MRLRVVIAPDSFKGTLDAAGAARALARGWRRERPQDHVHEVPQADGGEGSAAVIAAAVPGARWHAVGDVTGPDGAPVPGRWLELPDGTAVVELAEVAGLTLMGHPDARGATTFGLGQVLRAAVEAGAQRVVVAVGGSATTDGGAGALSALGLRILDGDGAPVPRGGGALARAARLDAADLLPPPPGGVEVLTDVTAPLTGPRGAAATFGPQKGADPDDVVALDAALARWAALLGGDSAAPGAGAAGGTAYGLATAFGARLVPGARRIAEVTHLAALLPDADVVLTGEGRFDETSLTGKVVGEVLAAAAGAVVVIAGAIEPGALEPGGPERVSGTRRAPALAIALTDLAGSRAAALADPAHWLEVAGERAAAWASRRERSRTATSPITHPGSPPQETSEE